MRNYILIFYKNGLDFSPAITVVDASSLINDYHSDDFLQHRGQALSEEDERSVVNLLVDQIEFANVIILNKVDRVDLEELEMAESIIKALNPDAVLIKSTYGNVVLQSILDTKSETMEIIESNVDKSYKSSTNSSVNSVDFDFIKSLSPLIINDRFFTSIESFK